MSGLLRYTAAELIAALARVPLEDECLVHGPRCPMNADDCEGTTRDAYGSEELLLQFVTHTRQIIGEEA